MAEPHPAPYDHHVPWSMCPFCGALQDGAANMTGGDAPDECDVCMCFECGRWCEFDAQGGRRKITPEKAALMNADPDIQRFNAFYWAYRAEHPERWPNG